MMTYRKNIVAAITALKDGSSSGSTSIAIKKQILANFPTDMKWNNATFLHNLKGMTQHGYLVRFKNGHYKLKEEAAAVKQERLKADAVAARQGKKD